MADISCTTDLDLNVSYSLNRSVPYSARVDIYDKASCSNGMKYLRKAVQSAKDLRRQSLTQKIDGMESPKDLCVTVQTNHVSENSECGFYYRKLKSQYQDLDTSLNDGEVKNDNETNTTPKQSHKPGVEDLDKPEDFARIVIGADPGGNEHICITCGRGFGRRSDLYKHTRTHIPDDKRPIVCEDCGKRFLFPKDLWRHKCKHTDPKFECNTCLRKFSRFENYKRHAEQKRCPPNLHAIHPGTHSSRTLSTSSSQAPLRPVTTSSESQARPPGLSLATTSEEGLASPMLQHYLADRTDYLIYYMERPDIETESSR